MFKRDDYIRTNHDAVSSKWQGFARSMLLRKPISETAELRKTFAGYSLISRDLAPKILIGANDKENFRKGKDLVGRYRVQGAFPGLYELGHDHARKDDVLVANLRQPESIRSRLRSFTRSFAHHDLLKQGLSQTILPTTQNKSSNRTEKKKYDSAEEREVSSDAAEKEGNSLPSILRLSQSRPQPVSESSAEEKEVSSDAAEKESNSLPSILRFSRSRPQPVSERPDDIVDGSDSASVCGFLLEDGTTCTTTPIKGRKRCTEHKGKRLSRVSPENHIPSEVPIARESKETEDICGVILPDMVRCRTKPVSRRKRCDDHKGMRVNAFFFLLNPTERDKAVKEDKSKSETCTGMNQEDPSPGLFCEATTKNGLPCTRSAPEGSRRCWQHKDKTLNHGSSENVQSATVSQVICGFKLYNGSVCEKSPVKGRKRCEEHKGMRITS